MTNMEKLTVRFPVDLLEDLQDIVLRKGYRNLSDAIRYAVVEFVERNRPGKPRVIEVELPDGIIAMMKDLIDMKLYTDYNSIVERAVEVFIETRIKEIREYLNEVDEIKLQILKRIATNTYHDGKNR